MHHEIIIEILIVFFSDILVLQVHLLSYFSNRGLAHHPSACSVVFFFLSTIGVLSPLYCFSYCFLLDIFVLSYVIFLFPYLLWLFFPSYSFSFSLVFRLNPFLLPSSSRPLPCVCITT